MRDPLFPAEIKVWRSKSSQRKGSQFSDGVVADQVFGPKPPRSGKRWEKQLTSGEMIACEKRLGLAGISVQSGTIRRPAPNT
jgi:hypothetical protein